MNWGPPFGCEIAVLAFAPYPGHVSARTTRLFWFGLATLGFAFWAYFVILQQELIHLRAWIWFAIGVYILYWQLYLKPAGDSETDSADE